MKNDIQLFVEDANTVGGNVFPIRLSSQNGVDFEPYFSEIVVPQGINVSDCTLGLDIGSNSLGWALIATKGQILCSGVLLFDEGITRVKGKDTLKTPASIRRTYRQARRLKRRRRYRKQALLKFLIDNGMCPLTEEGLLGWVKRGKFPSQEKPFMDWIGLDTYAIRAEAAEHEIDKIRLGRAMYNICQRRGYKNLRTDASDDDIKGIVKGGIAALSKAIAESGYDTLGQYANSIKGQKPIRRTYTGRDEHYEVEFAKICETQNICGDLRDDLHHAIFWQRPLRSQKHLVGKCPLEPKKNRCQMWRPEFEEFRMLSIINNIRIVDNGVSRELTEKERNAAIRAFYLKARYGKFSDIAKKIAKASGKRGMASINYPLEKSFPTCSVSHQLDLILGVGDGEHSNWRHIGADGKEHDFNALLDAAQFFEDEHQLIVSLCDKIGLTEEQAKSVSQMKLTEGYANYSLKAIRKILPFLRKGLGLHLAVALAKFPDIVGDMSDGLTEKVIADVKGIYETAKIKRNGSFHKAQKTVHEMLIEYLVSNFGVSKEKAESIYSVSADTTYVDCQKNGRLPPVNLGFQRNPLCLRSLTIVRKLINHFLKIGLVTPQTTIHVELARSINNFNMRNAYEKYNLLREDENRQYADKLRKAKKDGSEPTEAEIEKYRLAEEQGWKCVYTGREITIADIIAKAPSFDIEHTISRSRCGDNELSNKTLCDADFNRNVKGNKIPSELAERPNISVFEKRLEELETFRDKQAIAAKQISSSNPNAKSEACQKVLVTNMQIEYWRKKISYFYKTAEQLGEGFINRQLNDTGIMANEIVRLLKTVFSKVYTVNGAAVAFARKEWGLPPKDRSDSRHHAVDAIVIAELSRERFTKICTSLKDSSSPSPLYPDGYVVDPPFPGFAERVQEVHDSIICDRYSDHKYLKKTSYSHLKLSHPHQTSKGVISYARATGDCVRGQLHDETFYGAIQDPYNNGKLTYTIRKPIEDIWNNTKLADNIIDKPIRERVKEAIAETDKKAEEESKAIGKSVKPKPVPIYLNGCNFPIRHVTIRAFYQSLRQINRERSTPSEHEYKNPSYVVTAKGSNYQMRVFEHGIVIDNLFNVGKDKSNAELEATYGKFRFVIGPNDLIKLSNVPERGPSHGVVRVVKFFSC